LLLPFFGRFGASVLLVIDFNQSVEVMEVKTYIQWKVLEEKNHKIICTRNTIIAHGKN